VPVGLDKPSRQARLHRVAEGVFSLDRGPSAMARRKRIRACAVVLVLAAAAFGAAGAGGQSQQATEPQAVLHTQNTNALPQYEVFELTFQHDGRYANPFFDVAIDVTFTSPTGRRTHVGGFHYGSLQPPGRRGLPRPRSARGPTRMPSRTRPGCLRAARERSTA